MRQVRGFWSQFLFRLSLAGLVFFATASLTQDVCCAAAPPPLGASFSYSCQADHVFGVEKYLNFSDLVMRKTQKMSWKSPNRKCVNSDPQSKPVSNQDDGASDGGGT